MDSQQTQTPPSGPAKLDRWALVCLIVGLQAALAGWVPFVAPFLGLVAIAVFVLSVQARRDSEQPLRGRGMAIVGLLGGCFALIVGLAMILVVFVPSGSGGESGEPGAITVADGVADFPGGCDGFEFARSGDVWGILWT
ncbi:MAG: hypothetical protein JRF63_14305, partial [Deltaproteobacteria bacterium]|nr:hypothetical protein [Deltaproteobacteria bacterium]